MTNENNSLERSRKMELLHTPKLSIIAQLKESSLNFREIVFLASSNKIKPTDIRIYSPGMCDKIIGLVLRQYGVIYNDSTMTLPDQSERLNTNAGSAVLVQS